MLGHLRTWGKTSNPLCLFYCFDDTAESIEAIVVQVTNTPWGERHAYVIDAGTPGARLPKLMHVSPMLGMDLDYVFDWSEPGAALLFHVGSRQGQAKVFDAQLRLERREMSRREMGRLIWRRGLDNHAVTVGIYLRALALRLRGASFHRHPAARARPITSTAGSSRG
jgi:hypothetical protein